MGESARRVYISDVIPSEKGSSLRWEEHFCALQSAQTDIFGDMVPGGFVYPVGMPLAGEIPGGCILKFAPSDERAGWHYVTSGLAMPKDIKAKSSPGARCGYGREFVISTHAEEDWPLAALKRMMSFVAGQQPNVRPDEVIKWSVPAVPDGRPDMTFFVTLQHLDYPARLVLPGGTCDLIHLLGVTEAEVAYAKSHAPATPVGIRTLTSFFAVDDPYGPVTDGKRPCLTEDPDFVEMWERARKQVEAHWTRDNRT